VEEGLWTDFVNSPQRRAQVDANRISYIWDQLIAEFEKHMLAGTSSFRSHDDIREVEPALRYMAAESRTRRRLLADSLLDVMQRRATPASRYAVRVGTSEKSSDPTYVFLTLEHERGESQEAYRRLRREMLDSYCHAARYMNPNVPAVLGLAMEPGFNRPRSEDVLLIESKDWGPDAEERGRHLHEEVGLLRNRRQFVNVASEYPEAPSPKPAGRRPVPPSKIPRNAPCPCGSGRKFKKCCGAVA
jgi:uncharacterized protein YecA (UPF0149 family)